jgi:hypothetical protein
MKPPIVLISFLLVSAVLLIWAQILRTVWTRTSRVRSLLINVSISVSSIIYLFLALEVIFYTSVAVSDTFGFTLASRRWEAKYWRPINSFGYRDVTHSPSEFGSKQVLFVVGDSFVAGHGIAQTENRFSNILQTNLASQYVVVNIARNGWDTADEYQAILSYPYKPKKIILSYYINDILGAASRLGYGSPVRVEPPHNLALRFVIDHSYVLNFTYWRLYRFHHKNLGKQYWEFLRNSYSSPHIWEEHEGELSRIVTYTQSEGIDLSVVVFPNLREVKASAVFTSKVADFFEKHRVRVLNLEPLLEDRDPMTLVVNSMDAHPSEALNREVAELLTRTIQETDR